MVGKSVICEPAKNVEQSGAYVRDLDTGATLFARGENIARPPASVEKLYTSATALLRLGPFYLVVRFGACSSPVYGWEVISSHLAPTTRGLQHCCNYYRWSRT